MVLKKRETGYKYRTFFQKQGKNKPGFGMKAEERVFNLRLT